MRGGSKKERRKEELRPSPDDSPTVYQTLWITYSKEEWDRATGGKRDKLGVSGHGEGVKNKRVRKYQKRNEWRPKKKRHSDKLVECVVNSLLDLKPRVAHRHIFPE